MCRATFPAGAQLLSQEQDDGLMEYDYWLADSREFVEVIANPTSSQVLCVTYELRNDEGGASVDISEADAQAPGVGPVPGRLHRLYQNGNRRPALSLTKSCSPRRSSWALRK